MYKVKNEFIPDSQLTAQERMKRWKDINFAAKVNRPGIIFLKYFGMARFYRDGDCLGVLLRWYHPFNVIWLFVAFGMSLTTEETFVSLLKGGFTLSDFWKQRQDNMEWV